MSNKPVKFTKKQQLFIENYLLTLNATEAARRAGYSDDTAKFIGYENLTKPYLKAEIDRRFADLVPSANEVLRRLGDMARADVTDIINADDRFDFETAKANGKSHLIKKIKRTSWTDDKGNTFHTVELELHDSQAALVNLGKYYKLFTTPIEIKDWTARALNAGVTQEKIDRLKSTFELIATGQAEIVKSDTNGE